MRRLVFIGSIALVGVICPAMLAPLAVGQIPFSLHTLDNGLRVVLSEDHGAPTVSVAVVYDAGSRYESRGQTGLAHLVEHMMFRGSENVGSGEHYIRIATHGSPPVARTTADGARYVETVTANQLDLALFLEADRMRSLALTPAAVASERERIRSEREAVSGRPYGSLDEVVSAESFDSFGYAHPTLGNGRDMDLLDVEDVRAFHRDHYAPGNAVLAIAGDFDPSATLESVELHFGSIPPRPLPPPMTFVEAPRDNETTTSVSDSGAAFPRIDVAYRVPAGNTPQWYRLALAAEVLGGEGGRLGTLVSEGVALDAVATLDEQRVGSLFRISAILAPGQNATDALTALDVEIGRLRSEPVTTAELEGARARLERLGAEGLRSTAGLAEAFAANLMYYGDAGVVNRAATVFESVTVEHLVSASELYLVDNTRTVVVVNGDTP